MVLRMSWGQMPWCYGKLMHHWPFPINHLTPSFVESGTIGRHGSTLNINTRAPSLQGRLWQQNGGSSLQPLQGQPTYNQSSAIRPVFLCGGRDGVSNKLQLVPSPAWGHHKSLSAARSVSWNFLPPSSCGVTRITAQLEGGLLPQPGQKLDVCHMHVTWLHNVND